MSMRAVPFYCPYCGEQSIEPSDEERRYYCESCDRNFDVSFVGSGEGAGER